MGCNCGISENSYPEYDLGNNSTNYDTSFMRGSYSNISSSYSNTVDYSMAA